MSYPRWFIGELSVWNAQNQRAIDMYHAHPIISIRGLGHCRCGVCARWRGTKL